VTLSEKQQEFMHTFCLFVAWCFEQGYRLTWGQAYRTPAEAERMAATGKGIANSLHTQRLAVDVNLFINGEYQETTEAHRPLGEKWETMHPLARWGGRFNDGNHYSFEHNGVK